MFLRNFFASILLFAASFTLTAQLSPTGGPLNTVGQSWAVWADGDTAFVGFDDALYRTFNGGASWTLMNNGIPTDCDPRTIEVGDGWLVVGTNDYDRVYRSEDWGDSWIGGSENLGFLVPTASAATPQVQLIGGTNAEPSVLDTETGMWTATGAAGTLTHGLDHVGNGEIWQAAGGVTWAETRYSTDHGATWTTLDQEPQVDIGGGIMWSAMSQGFVRSGDRIIAGTDLVGFPVIYSDDNGVTWTPSTLTSTTWSDYGNRFVKVNDNHLLTTTISGLYKSVDQGATWTLIQAIPMMRSMALFKDDHLLVCTDNGVCEFENYGEGELVSKVGTTGGGSNLIEANGMLLSNAVGTLQGFDGTSWSTLTNQTTSGQSLPSGSVWMAGDSLFVSGMQLAGAHVDMLEFTLRSNASFNYQQPATIAEIGSLKLVGTVNGFSTGGIYRSTDGGITYTPATFTNTVAFGYGGLSGNYVERFVDGGSTLIADMNAGYAISEDNGESWTYYGTTWDFTQIESIGSQVYKFDITSFDASQRSLSVSADGGLSWTEVSLVGIPGGDVAGFTGFYGAWNLNGQISTHAFSSSPQGWYSWNGTAWEYLEGTSEAPAENANAAVWWNDVLVANWELHGTWASGDVPDHLTENQFLPLPSPNPANQYLNIVSNPSNVQAFTLQGKSLPLHWNGSHQLDVSQWPDGMVILQLTHLGSVHTHRILVTH